MGDHGLALGDERRDGHLEVRERRVEGTHPEAGTLGELAARELADSGLVPLVDRLDEAPHKLLVPVEFHVILPTCTNRQASIL